MGMESARETLTYRSVRIWRESVYRNKIQARNVDNKDSLINHKHCVLAQISLGVVVFLPSTYNPITTRFVLLAAFVRLMDVKEKAKRESVVYCSIVWDLYWKWGPPALLGRTPIMPLRPTNTSQQRYPSILLRTTIMFIASFCALHDNTV